MKAAERTQWHLGPKVRKASADLRLDAKRNVNEQSGTQRWFPYYAGFAETFVARLLQGIDNAEELRVLDPWNGAGTTTGVAHQLGHVAIGFDINPVLSIVASAKIAHSEDALHVAGLARRLATAPPLLPLKTDPLSRWLAPTMAGQYRGIEAALLRELASNRAGEMLAPNKGELPPLAAFLLLGLMRTARDVAAVRQGSNPTWVRPGEERRRSVRNFGSRWVEQVIVMADELAKASGNTARHAWSGTLAVADSRSLPLNGESVDLVLTSPPYCTRIDYVVSSSFELAALGVGMDSREYERMRRASMGTPLSRTADLPSVPSGWPRSVSTLLEAIRTHPSKASHSYYYRTYWQYFDDVMKSLSELHRVLRTGGAGALVVQSSYYKDIPIDLPALYVDCARAIGFVAEVTSTFDVRRAMSHINPHSRKYDANKHYKEAVVVLERAA